MRHKSGSVPDVAAYIDQWPVTREFKQHLDNLVNFLIPQYEKEGKAQLVIAAGCTGGMHRSVFIANHLHQLLKEKGCQVKLEHRDLMKNDDGIIEGEDSQGALLGSGEQWYDTDA